MVLAGLSGPAKVVQYVWSVDKSADFSDLYPLQGDSIKVTCTVAFDFTRNEAADAGAAVDECIDATDDLYGLFGEVCNDRMRFTDQETSSPHFGDLLDSTVSMARFRITNLGITGSDC